MSIIGVNEKLSVSDQVATLLEMKDKLTCDDLSNLLPGVAKTTIASALSYGVRKSKRFTFEEIFPEKGGHSYYVYSLNRDKAKKVAPEVQTSVSTLIETVKTMATDDLSVLIHGLGERIAGQIAAEVAMSLPKKLNDALAHIAPVPAPESSASIEVSVSSKVVSAKKKVVVLGLTPGQAAGINEAFWKKLELVFLESSCSTERIKSAMRDADNLAIMKFVDGSSVQYFYNHHKDKCSPKLNGLTRLREYLESLCPVEH